MLDYFLPAVALAIPAGRWIDDAGPGRRSRSRSSGSGRRARSPPPPRPCGRSSPRAIQGAFAGPIGPVVLGVVAAAVRPSDRGRALGLIAAVAPLGAVLGPAAGASSPARSAGARSSSSTCRCASPPPGSTSVRFPSRSHGGERLPLPGSLLLRETVLLGVSVIALLLTLDRLSGTRFDGLVLALPVVAVLAFSAWLRLPGSRRVTELALGRALASPIAALLSLVAATNLLYFVIPYFLQDVGQHGPAVTGAVLLALPAGMAAASLLANVLAGTVADRLGPRRMALGGATVVIAGLLLLLPLSGDARPGSVAWRLSVIGAGKGLFMGPNQRRGMLPGRPQPDSAANRTWGRSGGSLRAAA